MAAADGPDNKLPSSGPPGPGLLLGQAGPRPRSQRDSLGSQGLWRRQAATCWVAAAPLVRIRAAARYDVEALKVAILAESD